MNGVGQVVSRLSRRSLDGAIVTGGLTLLALGVVVAAQHEARRIAPAAASTPTAAPVEWARRSLTPVSNPDPTAPARPARVRPYRVVVTLDDQTAYVSLAGTEIRPGGEVAVIDVAAGLLRARIPVGQHPHGLALHPSGRWVVVTNRTSNYLSVIDVLTDAVVGEIQVPFYCEDLVFSLDGQTAYVSNFWKDQVLVVDLEVRDGALTGRLRELGFDREAYVGRLPDETKDSFACGRCGFRTGRPGACPRCGREGLVRLSVARRGVDGIRALLRGRCGTSDCHLYRNGGFYAGPDDARLLQSAIVHSVPDDPALSPLLVTTTATRHGGRGDAVDGTHHPGGVVFPDPPHNPDYQRLLSWIRTRREGPGIGVGDQPRDLLLSPDGQTLYVANTGSLDVSVIDLASLRETRRIFTRSPVNDLVWVEGTAGPRLVLATLGVGSGHPKEHHPGRESLDRDHPEAEFTLFRDPRSGSPDPLPLSEQLPLGPYDQVDGTAQEKFRDISNDLVLLDPAVDWVAAYRASEAFTRWTSDSFEALPGDKKGDVPPELMTVAGAFPEQIARHGDRLYVTLSGTFQVQEWLVDLSRPPAERLRPGRVFATGFKPQGIAVAGGAAGATLVVADQLSETVTLIDLTSGVSRSVAVGRHTEPFPADDFELGEFFVQTSVFSVDQDQSCVHCHYRDTSDGQRWSVSQVMGQSHDGSEERTGGSREVPDLRALVQKVPFFVEGILTIDEPLSMMMEHNPLVDFQGETPAGDFSGVFATPAERERHGRSADAIVQATGKASRAVAGGLTLADLIMRREVHFRRTSERHLGRAFGFREFQKFIGAYQQGEPRLLPNPEDPADPMLLHGKALFESPAVGCVACHPAPAFTDKRHPTNSNRSFPPLVTPANRDNVHTLVSADYLDALNGYVRAWDPDDRGRFEEREGFYVAPALRGLWARPAVFLHHGRAVGLREVVCTPKHPALRRFRHARWDVERPDRRELGLNESKGVPDTHGVTSHLSVWDVECLLRYLRSIE